MIKNFFIVALRSLIKQKYYSVINILGFAIGLACFLMIAIYINYEYNYDKYHKNHDRIYRIINVLNSKGVGERSTSSPFPLGPALLKEYPNLIESYVRFYNFQQPQVLVEVPEKKFNEKRFFVADSNVFKQFDYEFVDGNPETALNQPNSVVISESTALKYFGKDNPIGKSIIVEKKLKFIVTGVIKDVPSQSHFKFDFLLSITTLRSWYKNKDYPQTWVWNPCWTYILLKNNVSPETVNKKFPEFVKKYFFDAEKKYITLYLQPLTDIHLKSDLDFEIEPNSNISHIYIFAAIGLFVLIIACINFMNLATARSTKRAKEIVVRRIFGAEKNKIVAQFIGESIFLTLISLFFALMIIEILLPYFNEFTERNINLNSLYQPLNIILIVIFGVLIGLLSGIYPAYFLSSFTPEKVLRGLYKNNLGNPKLRKVLVLIQFSISIALIISSIVISLQNKILKNTDLGFDKSNIIMIPVNNSPIASKYDLFKSEILLNSDIISVTSLDDIIGIKHNTHEFKPEGCIESKWVFLPALIVRDDFIKTFKIKVIAGRDYMNDYRDDPIKSILINEETVKYLGWKSNEDAIGKTFKSYSGNEKVIGVVKNFNIKSLHNSITPFVINMKENTWEINQYTMYLAVKVKNSNDEKTINYLESRWDLYAMGRPFRYFVLEDEIDKMYVSENKLSKILAVFTFLAILISCIGLLGLTSFMTDQKTKEIGIRMVLGASYFSIIRLFTKEFFRLIIIANIIAWITAFLVLHNWLDNYSYKTQIYWWIFIISGFASSLIVILISGFRAYLSAKISPSITLKHE